MSENVRSEENSELTEKQEQLIEALLSLPTIEAASKLAGISDRTARRWFQLPHFQEAYRSAKQRVFDEALDELKDNVNLAIDTLKRNMTNDTEEPSPQVRAVQVRAATIWLQNAIQVHRIEQLAEELAELKEALRAAGL